MINVSVPGLGVVQVGSEDDLPAFEELLNNHLATGRKKENEPDKTLAILESMKGEIERLITAVVESVGKMKSPSVTVDAPIVNVETPEIRIPEINVPAPIVTVKTTALKPIKEVDAKNIKFSANGSIKSCKFVVIR